MDDISGKPPPRQRPRLSRHHNLIADLEIKTITGMMNWSAGADRNAEIGGKR
jgi:hypothetical protein